MKIYSYHNNYDMKYNYIPYFFSKQEMARLAKLEYEEQTKKDQELHDKIAAERAEARYTKHYESCNEVVNQLVDFTCKVAEYRELTEK